ncbi:hypothetical protein K474DRAFT_1592877 [Panus rudis PR-1116 ss-1]|nr:hypothetical protein K474DRAFT_1592877 [Panus rudis PR-1116 ss-1]
MSSQLNVAIFWDYENCEIPAYTDGYSVANGIRRIALEFGSIKVFKAYIETSEHNSPRALTVRSELTASGVSIIDCPHNGRKDVADKMLIVDMLAYAMDTPAPATVILISGDGDFVHALALLRHRRYNVVVIAPTLNNTHTSLRHQAMEIYDWCQDILPNAPRTPASAGSGRSFSIAAPRTTTLPATLNSSRPLRSAAAPFVPSSPLGKKGERPESPLTPQDDKEVDGERQPLRLYDAVAAGIKFDSFYAHISAPSTVRSASFSY